MNFLVSANTDIGIVKNTNQDSLSVKVINTCNGKIAFALLCDGMGGLAKGEVASASVIRAFDKWVSEQLPALAKSGFDESIVEKQWNDIIQEQNKTIQAYGARLGVKLGTTAVLMLITDEKYFIMNVGDSRIYEISDNLYQLTKDQSFVAREVELGNMTPEQAETDPRRSVLLQCVGASDVVCPDFFVGESKFNAVYMLCSDGFRHEITPQEIYDKLQPSILLDDKTMNQNTLDLIELNKQRNERDNISVALVRTF